MWVNARGRRVEKSAAGVLIMTVRQGHLLKSDCICQPIFKLQYERRTKVNKAWHFIYLKIGHIIDSDLL
jgi:hypothetical protein